MPNKKVLNLPLHTDRIQHQSRGGKQFSYIEASTVVRILDEAFGDNWSFKIIEKWSDTIGNNDILFNVHGRLEVDTMESTIVREYLASSSLKDAALKGDGRKKFLTDLSAADFQSGATSNIWKSTVTDCLKKCASQFGVGSELYSDHPDAPLFKPTFTASQREELDALSMQGIKDGIADYVMQSNGLGRTTSALHQFNVDDYIRAAKQIAIIMSKESDGTE